MSGSGLANSSLFFAHEAPRESQIGMISDGIDALKNGSILLAAAPTGIGKTAASLASALNAVNLTSTNHEKPKILFLTGRQSQHRIVIETIRGINERLPSGFSKIKVVDIIGRKSMCKNVDSTGKCSCEEGVTESEKRHLRSDLEGFIRSDPMHVDQVLRRSEKDPVCAWATAREAARSTNVIVCDYNHVFVEGVREASLPAMGVQLDNSIIIVDEAHNLPDRIRRGLERRITDQVFRRALDNVTEYRGNMERVEEMHEIPESNTLGEAKNLEKQIESLRRDPGILKWFEEKKTENQKTNGDDVRIATQEFLDVIAKAIEGVLDEDSEDAIARIRNMISRLFAVIIDEEEDSDDEEQNDCTRLAEILEICIRYRSSSALALVFDEELRGEPRVTSHLLDPSVVGEPIFEECLGSILMSGTLFPPEMYSDILGISGVRSVCKEYSSGFPMGNRPVLIASDVTSKYTERESSMESILNHIGAVIKNTKGNVAIFTPSYSMLEGVHEHFNSSWNFSKTILKEERGMSTRGVKGLIDRLYERKDMGGSMLFGVLSGKLSEGVDYSDNVLSALVCVGLPLPPPSARQDALLEYYSKKFDRNRAWKYASLQPAVNSILQALGRPIRKKEDRAIVVLLEKRLLERRVSSCMPAMQKMRTSKPERTAERVKAFFEI